jgi:hypothetical protein
MIMLHIVRCASCTSTRYGVWSRRYPQLIEEGRGLRTVLAPWPASYRAGELRRPHPRFAGFAGPAAVLAPRAGQRGFAIMGHLYLGRAETSLSGFDRSHGQQRHGTRGRDGLLTSCSEHEVPGRRTTSRPRGARPSAVSPPEGWATPSRLPVRESRCVIPQPRTRGRLRPGKASCTRWWPQPVRMLQVTLNGGPDPGGRWPRWPCRPTGGRPWRSSRATPAGCPGCSGPGSRASPPCCAPA